MMCVHLVSKQSEHSHEKYGLKKPVEIAIKKFGQRLSIYFINKNIANNESFHFSPAQHESILKRYC